jgi:hypothetical protein
LNRRRPVARTYVVLKQSFKITRLKAEMAFVAHMVTTKSIDTTKNRRRMQGCIYGGDQNYEIKAGYRTRTGIDARTVYVWSRGGMAIDREESGKLPRWRKHVYRSVIALSKDIELSLENVAIWVVIIQAYGEAMIDAPNARSPLALR